MRSGRVVVFFAAVLGSAEWAVCQDYGSAGPIVTRPAHVSRPESDHFNLRVQSSLVLIPVTVLDSSNHFVTGLQKENFKIFEENQPQEVTAFSCEDSPISVGLVFDSSGSMVHKVAAARRAVGEFLHLSNPLDEFLMVRFGSDAMLVQPFTRNLLELQEQLDGFQPFGQTALLDAVYRALHEMKKAHNPRKALLLISDGGDNHSRYTENEVKHLVRESDVQIYTVGIFGSLPERLWAPEERSGPGLLRWLAAKTGGGYFAIKDMNELPGVAARIGRELRNQYVLGYIPSNPQRDGRYRRVDVKLEQPATQHPPRAYWRAGYYAPSE